jgi:2-dehydro-3-deoxyphosphogluconate aldolase / (4S)-4-hydroxy-2-oxoglutarate aldolase
MFSNDSLPIMGIMRGIKMEEIEPLSALCIKCGLKYIEITMNTENAPDLISEMIRISENKLTVGAGTVLNMDDLDLAVNSGAQFIVSPSIVDDVVKRSIEYNISVFPGALTPTEVQKAWDLGATMVKLFPASVFGPSYIKELKGPFNKIRIMAVGGVSESNIHAFFENGTEAVAFGASIFNLKLLKEKNFGQIEEKLKLLIDNYYNWFNTK